MGYTFRHLLLVTMMIPLFISHINPSLLTYSENACKQIKLINGLIYIL
jgi:hypothetical protein